MALDYMCIQTNVTSLRGSEDVNNPSDNGAYIHGFYLEGAAWESGAEGQEGYLCE